MKFNIRKLIEKNLGKNLEENLDRARILNVEKDLKEDLEKLRKLQRKKYHPIINKIHAENKISKRTLSYVKEYGPNKNVQGTIIKESIKILLIVAIISSLGGLALEGDKNSFVTIVPLVILLPVLNNMIGSYGTIISSRFSTILYRKGDKKEWFKDKEIKILFSQVIFISILMALIGAFLAFGISYLSNFEITLNIILKVVSICIINVCLLVSLIFFVSISAGVYLYRKGKDPDNFLIPITTSVTDFSNMALLALLIFIFF